MSAKDSIFSKYHDLKPGEAHELSQDELAAILTDDSLQAFRSVLAAIREGVLVPARDIPAAQRKEIGRELGLMHWQLQQARKARDLPDLPGTLHLMREQDIERMLAEMEGAA